MLRFFRGGTWPLGGISQVSPPPPLYETLAQYYLHHVSLLPDDVSPINLTAAIVTESLIALSWEVPAIALNTPEVTVDMFNVSYKESGSDVINSMIVPGNSLAMVVMGLESDRDYAISVVVVYTYSAVTLESSPAERDDRTLAEGEKQADCYTTTVMTLRMLGVRLGWPHQLL